MFSFLPQSVWLMEHHLRELVHLSLWLPCSAGSEDLFAVLASQFLFGGGVPRFVSYQSVCALIQG